MIYMYTVKHNLKFTILKKDEKKLLNELKIYLIITISIESKTFKNTKVQLEMRIFVRLT